ncbi:MAG: hypothetical protein B5M55_07530 [Desulfococcus sp. 4484_242]|nr:MAG: hypothetical protein B5M55_07530 [Desulfococcus sp. 4484_242]
MNRFSVFILVLATVGLYAWPAYHWFSTREPASFVTVPAIDVNRPDGPFIHREFISPAAKRGMVHVSSICELRQGGLAAAWYGGSREGGRDVSIFFSTKGPDEARWSRPQVVVDRASACRDLSRYVKKVGNPVLFSDAGGRLWLIYVTITVGGWSGSSLNMTWSDDGGETWSRSRRLTLSPFFNISELVRGRPVPMSNGGFAVPIYHECLGYFPEILWLRSGEGGTEVCLKKSRMAAGGSFFQPSMVTFGPSHAVALYRSRGPARVIGRAITGDAGATWSRPEILSLPNPDSAVDALLLSDQRMLLAFNDSPAVRENLGLAVSRDLGRHWTRAATIESAPEAEFSYPYMIRTRDGRIHLVYTWDRKRIAHVVFNEAWVNAQVKGETW